MGHRKLFWKPKSTFEGDIMALGLSTCYLPLCSPVMEGENFWQTGQTTKEAKNCGKHVCKTTDHGENLV